jgi:hypothetical protein
MDLDQELDELLKGGSFQTPVDEEKKKKEEEEKEKELAELIKILLLID